MAELETDEEARRAWLTFAVIGGGPTGVEVAGQIAELSRRSLKGNFRAIDPAGARVLLFDGGKEILATFGDRLSGKATRELERLGVELRMQSKVTGVTRDGIVVAGPSGEETDRLSHEDLGGRGAGLAPGADRGRCGRRGNRSRGTRAGAPGLFVARSPRGVRRRRPDGARRPSGRRRGRDAVGDPRGEGDQAQARGRRDLRSRSATGISGAWPRSPGSARS